MLCPYCRNPLPEPTPAQCPSCGAFASSPEPTEVPEERREPDPSASSGPPPPPAADSWSPPPLPGPLPGPSIPWDARDRLGFATAFVETTGQVLARPSSFFRSMPVVGGLGSPLLYAVIAGWIGLAAAALYQAIWVSIVGPSTLPFGLERPELSAALAFLESWVGLVAQLVFGGLSVVISVFVTSGVLHVLLLVLGGARRGFEATFRVVCFTQATMLLLVVPLFLIPFCGLAGVAWCLALYVIGLAEAHQIGHAQALAAVLLPVLLVCCCCAGIVVTFAGAIASLVGSVH